MMEDRIVIPTELSAEGFKKGAAELRSAVNSLASTARSAFTAIGRGAGSVTKTAAGVGKSILASFNNMTKQVGSFVSRIFNPLNRSVQKAGTTMIGTFRQLMPMLIGVGSAFGILSKAVSAYMSQNEELSNKLSAIWTALGNLIGPIIEQIIDWVRTAVSYFLEFLRLLGVTSKTASQLSQKAKKSTEELRSIMGFDELNVLQEKQENDSGKGDQSLPDVQLPDWMKQLIDLLKSGKWHEFAKIITDKINELIRILDRKAYEIGKKLGYWLNGFMTIIADFIKNIHWAELGGAIAKGVNGILDSVEWENLGTIIMGKLYILWNLITGFLADLNWQSLAFAVSDTIIGALKIIDKGLVEALEIIDGDTRNRIQKISDGVKTFLRNVKWEEIGEKLSTALHNLSKVILSFDWEGNAKELGSGLAKLVNSVDKVQLAHDLSELLKTGFSLALGFWSSFIKNTTWEEVGAAVRAFFTNLFKDGDITGKLEELLGDAWDAALRFLSGLIGDEGGEESQLITSLRGLGDSIARLFESITRVWNEKIKPWADENVPKIIDWIADALRNISNVLNGDMNFPEFISSLGKMGDVLTVLAGISGIVVFAEIITFLTSLGPALEVIAPLVGVLIAVGGILKEAQYLGQYNKEAEIYTGQLESTAEELGVTYTQFLKIYTALGNNIEQTLEYFSALNNAVEYHDKDVVDLAFQYASMSAAGYDVTSTLETMATYLGMTEEELQAQIDAANGDVFAIEALASITGNLSGISETTREKIEHLAEWMNTLNDGSKGASASVLLTAEHLKYLSENEPDNLEAYNNTLSMLADKLGITTQALREQIEAADGNVAGIAALDEALANYLVGLSSSGELTAEYVRQLQEQGFITDEIIRLMEEQGVIIQSNGEVITRTADAVKGQANAAKDAADKQKEATKAISDTNTELKDMPGTADAAGKGMEGFGSATEGSTGKVTTATGNMEVESKRDLEALTADVTKAKEDIKKEFDEIALISETVKTTMEEIKRTVATETQLILGDLHSWRSSTISVLNEVLSYVQSDFQSGWQSAWLSARDSFAVIFSDLPEIMRGPVNGVIGILNQAIDSLNYLIDGANSLGQVAGFSIGYLNYLPFLAKGGVLKKGQVGLLEGDGAEAVVPLEKNTEWIGKVADQFLAAIQNGDYALSGNAKMLSTLQALENSVNFRAPAIAQGTVMPYSIDTGSGNTSSSPVDITELLEAIRESQGKMDDIIYLLENLQVSAEIAGGLRVLARAIKKELRKESITEGV